MIYLSHIVGFIGGVCIDIYLKYPMHIFTITENNGDPIDFFLLIYVIYILGIAYM